MFLKYEGSSAVGCLHVSEYPIQRINVKRLKICKLVKYGFVGKIREVTILRRSVPLGTAKGCWINISA